MHPTPWRIDEYAGLTACCIMDANGEMVETVYGRGEDTNGTTLATRIVEAVNSADKEKKQ